MLALMLIAFLTSLIHGSLFGSGTGPQNRDWVLISSGESMVLRMMKSYKHTI